MARHRTYSIEFKRQVVQEFLGGERSALREPPSPPDGLARFVYSGWYS